MSLCFKVVIELEGHVGDSFAGCCLPLYLVSEITVSLGFKLYEVAPNALNNTVLICYHVTWGGSQKHDHEYIIKYT